MLRYAGFSELYGIAAHQQKAHVWGRIAGRIGKAERVQAKPWHDLPCSESVERERLYQRGEGWRKGKNIYYHQNWRTRVIPSNKEICGNVLRHEGRV